MERSDDSAQVSSDDRLARQSEELLQSICRSPRAALVRVKGQWTFFAERATDTVEPKLADLLQSLKQSPVAQLLPHRTLFVDKLPATPDGAVDREMLGNGWGSDPHRSQEPRGVTEELLSAIWSEVLGGAPVNRDVEFFSLGADAADAAKLAARIRDIFRVNLTSPELFEHQVLHAQARLIEQRMVRI